MDGRIRRMWEREYEAYNRRPSKWETFWSAFRWLFTGWRKRK
jgi:hypothetical protein